MVVIVVVAMTVVMVVIAWWWFHIRAKGKIWSNESFFILPNVGNQDFWDGRHSSGLAFVSERSTDYRLDYRTREKSATHPEKCATCVALSDRFASSFAFCDRPIRFFFFFYRKIRIFTTRELFLPLKSLSKKCLFLFRVALVQKYLVIYLFFSFRLN